MSEIRSRLQNGNRVPYNEIDQIPMKEVSHQEQQESVIVPPAVAVENNEKQEAIVSSPAEVEELLSNEIAVEASPEVASKSSSQSKPINVAPFKTVRFSSSPSPYCSNATSCRSISLLLAFQHPLSSIIHSMVQLLLRKQRKSFVTRITRNFN
jgi:hypothetical protein